MDANTDSDACIKKKHLAPISLLDHPNSRKIIRKKNILHLFPFFFRLKKKHVKTSPTLGVVAMAFSLESKVLKTHLLHPKNHR